MALSQKQKSDIRRHLKYGNIGLTQDSTGGGSLGANAGWRYFGEWGDLEAVLDQMAPVDECSLTGYAYGSLVIQGPDPNNGDNITIQVSGGNLSAPVSITQTAANQNRTQFGLALAGKCNQDPSLASAGFKVLMPSSSGNANIQNPLAEIEFKSPKPFLLAVTAQSGLIGAGIDSDGTELPDPQSTFNDTLYVGYLPILNALHGLTATVSDRLAIDKADVFTARKSERKERKELYYDWLRDMADFLCTKLNPDRSSNVSSNIGIL